MTIHNIEFRRGKPVILLSDKLGTVEAVVTGVGWTGGPHGQPRYFLDTIFGPLTAYGYELASGDNVTVLHQPVSDTAPCELEG